MFPLSLKCIDCVSTVRGSGERKDKPGWGGGGGGGSFSVFYAQSAMTLISGRRRGGGGGGVSSIVYNWTLDTKGPGVPAVTVPFGKSASISQWLPYTVHTVHTETTCPAQSINQYTPPPTPAILPLWATADAEIKVPLCRDARVINDSLYRLAQVAVWLHTLSVRVHCQTGYLFHFCHHWHSIVLLSVLFPIPSGVCCTE